MRRIPYAHPYPTNLSTSDIAIAAEEPIHILSKSTHKMPDIIGEFPVELNRSRIVTRTNPTIKCNALTVMPPVSTTDKPHGKITRTAPRSPRPSRLFSVLHAPDFRLQTGMRDAGYVSALRQAFYSRVSCLFSKILFSVVDHYLVFGPEWGRFCEVWGLGSGVGVCGWD
jgi:hypothetical protein